MDETRSMQPQSASLCDDEGNVLVDFIGRFERISEDFSHVEETLGLSQLSLKWRNASQGPHQLFERQNAWRNRRAEQDELTADDIAFLAARFEDDFRRFGYEP